MNQSELSTKVGACLKHDSKSLGWKSRALCSFRVEGEPPRPWLAVRCIDALPDARTGRAIDRRPQALARYGQNDLVIAMGRKAWLFCGSELAGQRAAMVMSQVQSAKLNGHDPWAYLKDVLERLLAHPHRRIDELLPHRWGQAVADTMPMHESHRSIDR